MIKTRLLIFICTLLAVTGLRAQVTSDPSPLQEDATDVTIYFHADQGNQGLKDQPASAQIYAHTGACLSNGQTWVNAPTWGDNSAKYKLTYVSENLWKLYIGDIRTYYGITDPAVNVTRLAFVFRNADNSKEGKGPGNSDIFLDLVDAGLQIALESNLTGTLITPETSTVTFKVGATKAADLTLSMNGTQVAEAKGQRQLTYDVVFTAPGNYEMTATATADGETVTTSRVYCYAEGSPEAPYPGGTPKMGAVKNADGSVTFCLGAPQKQSVIIVGSWDDYQVNNDRVMNYTDVDGMRYFWITVNGLENDRQYGYYYLVDGTIKVGDPYARLVLDPDNDKYISPTVYPDLMPYPSDFVQGVALAVYQGNINDYDWQVKDFKGVAPSDLIIYELLIRDFTGTEGKALGDGTVRGVIEKFDYLKSLGVNAIELLPINEFNGNISWGYNPNFYFAPDKAYGTPDDYKELIDLCHQNGIAVILDMVFNQSDWQHPWYRMYEVGSNPFYNATAPHAYSVLNDWNQGYPLVEKQWVEMLKFWLSEYKVDGFRFDLVKGLGNNDSYPSSSDNNTNKYNQSRIDRMIRLHAAMKEVNPDAYFINEDLATAQEENAMAQDGQLNWANVNDPGCQFAMGYNSGSSLARMWATKDGGRLAGSTVAYLESHDEQRLAYKQDMWGVDGVKGNNANSMKRLAGAAAQMILVPGSHMIWMFSEMGNAQNTKDATGGNNTSPKIVNWALLDKPENKALMENYAAMIKLRLQYPELFSTTADYKCYVSNVGTTTWPKGRWISTSDASGEKELHAVINTNTDQNVTVELQFKKNDNAAYHIEVKSLDSNPSFDAAAKTVTIGPNDFVVITSNNVSGVDDILVDGDYADAESMKAYDCGGAIRVTGAPAAIGVYTMAGAKVATLAPNADATLSVAPGLYIVTSGAKSAKVLVK